MNWTKILQLNYCLCLDAPIIVLKNKKLYNKLQSEGIDELVNWYLHNKQITTTITRTVI